MDLRVFLKLDGSGFQQGLTSAKQAVGRFGQQAFGGLKEEIFAAFTVGALVEMSKKTIEWAGHVQNLSDRLGVSVEYLQQMQYVAKRSGSGVDTLAGFFEKLAANRVKALEGTEESPKMISAFGKLGVSPESLSTNGVQGLTDMIGKAFQSSKSPEMLIGALREVGGKGAGELIAAFTSGLEEGRQAAVSAGAVMSEDTIAALKEVEDEFEEMKIQIMVGIGPAILKVIGWLTNLWNVIVAGASAIEGFIEKFNWKNFLFGGETNFREAAGEASTRSQAVMDEAVDKTIQQEQEAKARASARAARKRPEIIPIQTYEPKHKEKQATDSLISVGNFLGAGRGTIESVAQETNKILREHGGYLKIIADAASKTTPNGTMQIPA